MNNAPQLKIVSVNCKTLISQTQQIKLQQILKIHNPHFALLQETRLTENRTITIHDYDILYNFAPKGQVGTAIAVKRGIKTEIEYYTLSKGEAFFVSFMSGSSKVLIVSLYICPSFKFSKIVLSELESIINKFDIAIIGGDFNTPHSYLSPNTKALENLLCNRPDIFKISSPLPTRGKSYLDLFIYKDQTQIIKQTSCKRAQLFADHHAITLSINSPNLVLPPSMPRTFINYDSADWTSFCEFIELKTAPIDNITISTTEEIDSAIHLISSSSNAAIDTFLRRKSESFNKFKGLPQQVQDDLATKAKIQKLRQRSIAKPFPNYATINTYDALINFLNKQLNSGISKHLSNQYHKQLSALSPENRNMFKEIDRITRKRVSAKISPLIDNENVTANSPSEICKTFRTHFKDIFKTPKNFCKLKPITPIPESKITISSLDTARIIKQLKNKKSAGPDNISNFIIKKFTPQIICRLTKIYTACIDLSYFPTEWKKAKIIPLFKKGVKSNPANYRPISLVNNLGKVLEKFIQRQLNAEVASLKIIPVYQCGFREKHSTIDAAAVLRDSIVEAKNFKESISVCLIDISRAFDSVWHRGLVWKLANHGISANIVKIIENFLSGRTAKILANGNQSKSFKIGRGVPQGTILGPVLYNIYVAGQPAKRNSTLQYADDTALIGTGAKADHSIDNIQKQIDKLTIYYNRWGIKINAAKTELAILGVAQKTKVELKVGNDPIKRKKKFTYLGIDFNTPLKPSCPAKARLNKAKAALTRLNSLLASKKVALNVKRKIYTTILRPVLTYGCPLWANANLDEIEIWERKVLRKITGLYRREDGKYFRNELLYEKSKVSPIRGVIDQLSANFIERYVNHSNDFIKEWANAEGFPEQKYAYTRNIKSSCMTKL